MKNKGGCFRFFLALICALSAVILFRACTLKSYAADNILLSLEQTYALYGHHFDVTYYNPDKDYSVNVPAEYIGNSYELVPNNHFNDIYFTGYSNMTQAQYAQFCKMPCLIYAIYNFDGKFKFYNGNAHFNITKKFPVSLDNITHFQQNIFWSGYYDNGATAGVYNYSDVLCNTSFDGAFKTIAVGNNAFQIYNRQYGYCVFPTYKINDTVNDVLDEDRLAYLYGVQLNFDYNNGESFSISEQTFRLNGVGALDVANRGNYLPGGGNSDEVLTWPLLSDAYADVVLLVISCPILTGYEPPPATTPAVVPGTQAPATYTDVTVDLSGLESGVAEIVRQQRLQLNLMEPMYINGVNQVNQLNTIIGQLDAIYNRMLQNGDVPADLVEAAALQTLNPDIANQIHTALRGTWPTMPSNAFGDAPAVFGAMFDLFRDPVFSTIFYIGIVSLALSVAGWFLFKGRN